MAKSTRRVDLNVVGPVLAAVALVLTWGRNPAIVLAIVIALVLGWAVLAAVHHAEVIALRVGEPLGSLILAVAVTVIEVGLIVTLMLAGGDGSESLARDTVFAAVMITCNGILGISLLVASMRHGIAVFNAEGTGAALGAVATVATLALVLPSVTTTVSGPEFSTGQLAFAAASSLALYVLFVLTQTRQHRDFFLPVARDGALIDDDDHHAERPSTTRTTASLVLLTIALISVVGLAKVESPAIEDAVRAAGFPKSFVGVVIAMLVLLPETLAAVRAARRDRVQISLNLALGSAMASIGLTIPVIAIAMIWIDGPLVLGLNAVQVVLLAITIIVATLTVVPGRATRLQGGVHLVLMFAFVFLAIRP